MYRNIEAMVLIYFITEFYCTSMREAHNIMHKMRIYAAANFCLIFKMYSLSSIF